VVPPEPAPLHDLALPPGTESVVGVYVNGVEKVQGHDYEVLPDRVRFREPLQRRANVTGIGKLLLSVGIGVYPKGDVVDIQVRRRGGTDVVRARPFGE
jgi:hypothetical protein